MGWVRHSLSALIARNPRPLPVAQIVHFVQAGAIAGRRFARLTMGVPRRQRDIDRDQTR